MALDGSQDHLGRGDAARLWVEARISQKRAAAIADVDALWAAGTLTWESRRDVIESCPRRGQVDMHREGQEDEGTAGGAEHGATGRGLRTTRSRRLPRSAFLKPPLGGRSSGCRSAKSLNGWDGWTPCYAPYTPSPPPPPHIVQTLEQAHHMLIQQTTARSALTQLLPQPRVRFACGRRRRPSRPVRDAQQLALPGALQQTPTKKGRGRHAPTGALAAPVAVLGGEQRCSRQEHRQQGLRCRSLGQGRGNGGGKVHGRNRGELMLPVAVGFHALAGDAAADWPRNFRIWKAHMSR